MEWLVTKRHRRLAREMLLLSGVEVHARTAIGHDFHLMHRGFGTVIHPNTVIGDRVAIYQQVTIGRADAFVVSGSDTQMERIELGDDVILYPGCRVLGGPGVTRVGNGSIVAANGVLTQSTGDSEVWGGVPARKIGDRLWPER
jgi:serine O-acetyltransferase